MAETPRGIVYPESGAHTRLWEHFQALADTTDDAITAGVAESTLVDSGWQVVPYASGWRTSTGSAPLSVRKIGKIVYLRGRVTNTAGSIPVAPGGGYVVGTIPGGYTPPQYDQIVIAAAQNPGTTPARVSVGAGGAVTLWVYSTATAYVSVDTSYVSVP